MRYSKHRKLILDIIKSSYEHPTAQMIYNEAKKEIPSISLGTVYRNLNQLIEDGFIIEIETINSPARYDSAMNIHSHIICNKCHQVCDIDNSFLENIDCKVKEITKYQHISHNIIFTGICPKCQEKKEGN